MRLLIFTIILFSSLAAPALAAVNPPKPGKLGLCVGCHGVDGRAMTPGTPHLSGQDATYLRRTLTEFRDGKRVSNPMTPIAGALQPRDIDQLAAWYAAQTGVR